MWTLETLPSQWALPAYVAGGVLAQALDKRSTCELEADACVEHVLNRAEVASSLPVEQAMEDLPSTSLSPGLLLQASQRQLNTCPCHHLVAAQYCSCGARCRVVEIWSSTT